MNILRKTPGSTLALYRMRDPLGAHVVRHLSEEAEARGIHPQRIKWFERLPRKQHAQRIASQCDLFLDHLLYGAHTTGADALWSGVPLVSVSGAQMASRVASSLLLASGQGSGSVASMKEYVDVAAALAVRGIR